MAYVIIYTPNAPAQKLKLEPEMIVGRALGCQIWLDDRKLSRQHCRIERDDGDWIVRDLDSSNGTRVNGRRIDVHTLIEGDTIEVGPVTIAFREGDYVGHRPADPIEAMLLAPRKLAPAADNGDTTIVANTATRAERVLPEPKPSGAGQLAPRGHAVSLPFTRPPARPIVKSDDDENGSGGSRWVQALMSRLRRR